MNKKERKEEVERKIKELEEQRNGIQNKLRKLYLKLEEYGR